MSAYALAFHALCRIGRPVGGVRPRRVYHWLARRAWGDRAVAPEAFRWYRDAAGYWFRLHPHYLIDRSIIAFGGYEPDLLRFLEERLAPGMVCLDVGANLGQVTMRMAGAVRPGGRVHAFEPVPHILERLRAHVARNGLEDVVRVEALALSDRSGEAEFQVAGADAHNQGMGTLAVREHPVLSRTVRVRTERLDEFVQRQGLERLDFVKVDIQGAEPFLLEGAAETLARFAPRIVMEVSPTDLRAAGSSSAGLVARLERAGYAVHELRGSRIGRRLRAAEVGEDYEAEAVFCEPARG